MLFLSFTDDPELRDYVTYLYNKYKGKVLGICTQILGNEADGEDALEETFVRVLRFEKYFRGKSNEDTVRLLMKFAKNTALNLYDKNKRTRNKETLYDDLPEYSTSEQFDTINFTEECVLRTELIEATQNAIDSLTPLLRDTVILRYYNGMKLSEIAELFGSNVPTVSMRLTRAREIIKNSLIEQGFDNE